jgi:hypothetical protein
MSHDQKGSRMNWQNNLLRTVTTVGLAAACLVAAALPETVGAEPHGLSVRQDKSGVTIEVDGGPFAAYLIDEGNKPSLWPIVGPTGKPMTRAYPMRDLPEEPAAQRDHPHHRGEAPLAIPGIHHPGAIDAAPVARRDARIGRRVTDVAVAREEPEVDGFAQLSGHVAQRADRPPRPERRPVMGREDEDDRAA